MLVIASEKLRKVLRILIPLVLIPLIVIGGALLFDDRKYAWITLAVVILSLLLFYAGFEKRTVGTRRMIIVAVMTALSVLGRFVFSVIPAFKPITAIVIITAIWIGSEAGFLVGSLSAVISNFFFGQGPWTPFQMLSWGLIGLLAGLMSGGLKKSKVLLALYGIFAGVLYTLTMDLWTVLFAQGGFSASMYLAAFVTALPYTACYAVSNVIFLLLLGRPFGEKLERVKIRYGV